MHALKKRANIFFFPHWPNPCIFLVLQWLGLHYLYLSTRKSIDDNGWFDSHSRILGFARNHREKILI